MTAPDFIVRLTPRRNGWRHSIRLVRKDEIGRDAYVELASLLESKSPVWGEFGAVECRVGEVAREVARIDRAIRKRSGNRRSPICIRWLAPLQLAASIAKALRVHGSCAWTVSPLGRRQRLWGVEWRPKTDRRTGAEVSVELQKSVWGETAFWMPQGTPILHLDPRSIAATSEAFQAMVAAADANIARVVLGANSTPKGEAGSHAAAARISGRKAVAFPVEIKGPSKGSARSAPHVESE